MPLKLSILVPVYNEAATVEKLLRRLAAVDFPIEREIIAVDDGSADGSREILQRLAGEGWIRVLVHPGNQGKGAAILSAARQADGQVLVIQDADLELDPHDLPALLEPILAGDTQVCFGSRFLKPRPQSSAMRLTYWANRILNGLCNLLNGIAITDFNTCYKMLTREVLGRLQLSEKGFAMEPEITTKLARLGVAIVERPIRYEPRTAHAGKKIRVTDFFRYVRAMIRYRFFWSPTSPSAAASVPFPAFPTGVTEPA